MAVSMRVIGMEKAVAAVESAVRRTRDGTSRGLEAAGRLVKEESQKIVPVDEGILRASHYVGEVVGDKNKQIEVGAAANYAQYVHENVQADRTRKGKGESKFLVKAYTRNKNRVVELVVSDARRG